MKVTSTIGADENTLAEILASPSSNVSELADAVNLVGLTKNLKQSS